MPPEKGPRKCQRTGKHSCSKSKSKPRLVTFNDDRDFEPLGSSKRVWEEDKDDEERRLEGALFEKPYVPFLKGGSAILMKKTKVCRRQV